MPQSPPPFDSRLQSEQSVFTSSDSSKSQCVPGLDPEVLQWLRSTIDPGNRIIRIDTECGPAIVKGQRPTRGKGRYRLLNVMANAVGLPLLKAVPAWGGRQGQEIELTRLHRLAAAGLPVPRILHAEDQFFVMESLGQTDLAYAITADPSHGLDQWRRGGDLLLQVHTHDQYLSQAFARNFIVNDKELGLIDFEDDPLEVMSLSEAQARDWLAYLHSTVWLLPGKHLEMLQQLENWLASESLAVRSLMAQAARRLGWLRRLPAKRKPWGRDVVSLQAVAQLLHDFLRMRSL